jgi:hypothetical protein
MQRLGLPISEKKKTYHLLCCILVDWLKLVA